MDATDLLIYKPEFVLKSYRQKDTSIVMEKRYSSGIIIALCGILDFEFKDITVTLKANDAVFIPEGSDYTIKCKEYSESIIINFYTVNNHPVTALKKIDGKIAQEYFQKLNILLIKPHENRNMILSTYYKLLSDFFDNYKTDSIPASYVKKAEIIILENFSSQSFSSKDIAKELNISQVYLRKLFVKYCNMPPSKYLMQTRMHRARQMIIEGAGVSQTFKNVGYCDIYQFSRAYKKYFGYPPSKTK